ncbi:YdcH family protein [Marinomonas sp. PE14-40]|uniref:YdcH family protein n=1 Tax=Marinomonas sp. PE14-40 TaxID=3060621 RepID=UPI003F66CD69
MLGENHLLTTDFPEFTDTIKTLCEQDSQFQQENSRYTLLDKEIRELELSNTPISDDEMHKLKHDRSTLKDALYARLKQMPA